MPTAGQLSERLRGLAEELVRKGVDVILCNGTEATLAAARATHTIPIVFFDVPFPVEQGLIDSLSRPGRNVTATPFTQGSRSKSRRGSSCGRLCRRRSACR